MAFAFAFLVGGVGESALLWTHDRSYFAQFARDDRLAERLYHFPSGDRNVPLEDLLRMDDRLRTWVLCRCSTKDYVPLFLNARELSHLDDVADVYAALQPVAHGAALLGAVLLVAGLLVGRRAIRRAVLLAAGAVLVLGVVAALAFEPAFVLFHEVFFPQGNFLFDPAADNLVLLYPESYWLGVTLRMGATFILLALFVAGIATIPIRSATTAGTEESN